MKRTSFIALDVHSTFCEGGYNLMRWQGIVSQQFSTHYFLRTYGNGIANSLR
jgi:hypothetical protein